jgi:hypothetical protein
MSITDAATLIGLVGTALIGWLSFIQLRNPLDLSRRINGLVFRVPGAGTQIKYIDFVSTQRRVRGRENFVLGTNEDVLNLAFNKRYFWGGMTWTCYLAIASIISSMIYRSFTVVDARTVYEAFIGDPASPSVIPIPTIVGCAFFIVYIITMLLMVTQKKKIEDMFMMLER